MFKWLFGSKPAPVVETKPVEHKGSTLFETDVHKRKLRPVTDRLREFEKMRPDRVPLTDDQGNTVAMDETDYDTAKGYLYSQPSISDALAMWYSAQSFIGHQLSALIAQHWLIAKACDMPARDAIRNGFNITSIDGEELPDDVLRKLKRADKKYKLTKNLLQYVTFGRIFGIRICIFEIDGADYSKPFNIDGVKPGTYRGMTQIDPYWCTPELDAAAASQPSNRHFYEPTYWQINGQRYHRTHLMIFRNGDLADILKPAYQYGGIPVPQLIMERVYNSERTANEAPLLTLTKRTNIFKTDMSKFMANFEKGMERIRNITEMWSNTGTRVIGTDDEASQLDTGLADLDSVIMTQYQLVAAAARVPATKLLGTAPKGFNATGEFDESSYHEELESLQEHDLTEFVDRHHLLVIASDMPEQRAVITTVVWEPLDSPTAKEQADINKLNAETAAAYVNAGALDGVDVRNELAADRHSKYNGIDVNKVIELPEPAAVVPPNV